MLFALFATLFVAVGAKSYKELYVQKARSPSDASHPVTLFVKLDATQIGACPNFLAEVSTPGSAKYGKHWSFESMKQFSNKKAFDATLSYLRSIGAQESQLRLAPNLEFITVDGTVAEIERLFNVELYDFEHKENSDVVMRRPTTPLAVPSALVEHVEHLSGLDGLPHHRAGQLPLISSPTVKRQSDVTTPQLIWSYYGVNNRTIATKKATQAIFASLGQSFSPSDLKAFQAQSKTPSTPFAHVIGQNTPSDCSADPNNCVEANLDTQQITVTAQLTDNTFWSIPASAQDIFLAWTQAMTASKNPPLVTSISYGSLAPEDPATDKQRFASEACKLGLRGITIVVASGDDGVANFQARGDPTQCGFTPSYPATCPFVTSVGGTQGPESGQTEIMCSSQTGGGITSGGGFSVYYDLPDWQASFVTDYLANGPNVPPQSAGYNGSMRAYPDVAIAAYNYEILIAGQGYYGSGTSASSPVFASFVSLVNGIRISLGKPPVGFLNPALYAMGNSTNYATYYNDITSGVNNCCAGDASSATCCQYGFEATTGWDPTTGLGSPKFAAWSKYLISL